MGYRNKTSSKEGYMNIPVDRESWNLLCPKCNGRAEMNNNVDIECIECGYIYYMFSDRDNSFQIELDYGGIK